MKILMIAEQNDVFNEPRTKIDVNIKSSFNSNFTAKCHIKISWVIKDVLLWVPTLSS